MAVKKKLTQAEIIRQLRADLRDERAITKRLIAKIEHLEFDLWSANYIQHRTAQRASWGETVQ